MEPKNEQKPVNVLTEFLTDWIRKNSKESAPFYSFEVGKRKNVEQKDVERWIFNCNYLYYRLGDCLFEKGFFSSSSDGDKALFACLDAFKTIKDSNPLNLRQKTDAAVINELAKDWPPLVKSSRNRLDKFLATMEEFRPALVGGSEERDGALDDFIAEMKSEAEFYSSLARTPSGNERAVLDRCKMLIPLWCVKEINPLYTLLIWHDESAISELCERMKESFERCGYSSANGGYKHDAYTVMVKRAQSAYLEDIDYDGSELGEYTIAELVSMYDRSQLSVDRIQDSPSFPRGLLAKSQLIWNVVICSIFGPKEVVNPRVEEYTALKRVPRLWGSIDEMREGMCGEVNLRRRYRNRGVETVGRIVMEDVRSSCLWKVIGSVYDEEAPLPPSDYTAQYEDMTGAFIATRCYDGHGRICEGDGDSRYHVEISVKVDESGRKELVARDLGSTNGSYVLRQSGRSEMYYVLKNDDDIGVEAWAPILGVSPEAVEIVDELELRRGDIINLCNSCFEIV